MIQDFPGEAGGLMTAQRAPFAPRAPGEPLQNHVPGLVWAFGFDETGRGRPLLAASGIEDIGGDHGFCWLHFDLVDHRVGEWCESRALFSSKALQTFVSSDSHLRVEYGDDLIWGVFADIRHEFDSVTDVPAPLHFVMNSRLLVTGRRQPLHGTQRAREKVDAGAAFSCPCEVLEVIAEYFLDDVHALAEALEQELNGVEDRVVVHAEGDEGRRLAPLRHTLVRHARHLSKFNAVMHRFVAWSEQAGLPRETREAATRLLRRTEILRQDVQAMQDRARLLREEAAENRANEMNRHLYVLSTVTAFLLPPTLVVGVFGMNTRWLPFADGPHGFGVAIGLGLASSVFIYFVLRRLRDR